MSALFTGMPLQPGTFDTNAGDAGFSDGPSLDQVLAKTLSAGKRFSSLEVSVRWSTGIAAGGQPHPSNQLVYQAAGRPVPVGTDPAEIFKRIFGGLPTSTGPSPNLARQKCILDFVGGQYSSLMGKLGAADWQKLDAHLTQVRALEVSIGTGSNVACVAPVTGDTSDYAQDTATPKTGKVMADLLVMALACDLTRVGTFQWTDSEAKHTYPFLGLNQNLHYYEHDGGFQPQALSTVYKWYTEQFTAFVQALVDHNLINDTVVVWGSGIQRPDTHAQDNMPYVLAGHGGGLRGGVYAPLSNATGNDVLVTAANLCGLTVSTFGRPEFCHGPLPGLT